MMSQLDPQTASGASAIEPALAPLDTVARHLADAVTAAGAIALAMFRTKIKTWNKDNDSPVTEADIAVDRFLYEKLAAIDPDYGWLSEETADNEDRLSRKRVWMVDPIDGTRAFMDGGPDWAVSAALVEDGRPIVAALFAPVTDEMFFAIRGRGAKRNGTPITASGHAGLKGARIAGPPFMLDRIAGTTGLVRMPRVRSLALRLTRVATGELDLALASGNCHDWDIAAADLLVNEAGGALTGYDGAVPVYNVRVPRHRPLVCAGPNLHQPMLALAQDEFGAF